MSKPRKLSKQDRHCRILDESKVAASVRISTLAEHLGVSTETVRRDLDELCGSGLIDRIYGGATTLSSSNTQSFGRSAGGADVNGGAAIGAAAAQCVRAGQTVMLSGGDIALHAARELARFSVNLIVVTCNIRVALEVAKNPTIQVMLAPGIYDAEANGVSGEDTVSYLHQYHADIAIVETGALTREGAFEESPAAAMVKRAMLQRATTRVLVAAKSTQWCRPVRKICAMNSIDEIIVHSRLEKGIVSAAHKMGASISTISSDGNQGRSRMTGSSADDK